jgi:teichuronic acid biosynthesis glycosyltransferase TuaC
MFPPSLSLLIVATAYPHAGHPFGGIHIERTVSVLREVCAKVAVLAPRPYVPKLLSLLSPRWSAYARIPAHDTRSGVIVARPAYPQLPRVGGQFCFDTGAYILSRCVVAEMHGRMRFDAVLCFDLRAGGLALRIASDLGAAVCGWAGGDDVRVLRSSSQGRVLIRALNHFDLVFYQSHELLEKAAELLQISADRMPPRHHVVLSRGVPAAPAIQYDKVRARVRRELGIVEGDVLLLSTGRICREKGVYELLEAFAAKLTWNPRIKCVLLGSMPGFDETRTVEAILRRNPVLHQHVRVLPACAPDHVWEYLCAADLFVFTSHHEGLPGGLLEAMAMGLPVVAFGIPAVAEIEGGTGALLAVPAFDVSGLAQAILGLVERPEERARLGEQGRRRVIDEYMLATNVRRAIRHIEATVQQCRRGPESRRDSDRRWWRT